jgi:UDP:flavonoid glycosyltransferase YjiC (YdhE family)
VPLVCVPQMIEQAVNADRVAELGLGVRLDPDALTPDGLRTAVDAVASDPATRAALECMRVAIRRAGGPVAAADAIEAHLGDRSAPG